MDPVLVVPCTLHPAPCTLKPVGIALSKSNGIKSGVQLSRRHRLLAVAAVLLLAGGSGAWYAVEVSRRASSALVGFDADRAYADCSALGVCGWRTDEQKGAREKGVLTGFQVPCPLRLQSCAISLAPCALRPVPL